LRSKDFSTVFSLSYIAIDSSFFSYNLNSFLKYFFPKKIIVFQAKQSHASLIYVAYKHSAIKKGLIFTSKISPKKKLYFSLKFKI